ncbi:hypothetical protein [Bradyrhizobium liaoningense]|uniref:hypothetical protein n=1 Tax=Bradyrhizobium liaoningense TaxID=43992 RepID=UPI001BA8EAC4|nr:hypothetical protein [Bradyrhizobium liaoningense]MBR0712096.1 hypothetical protein [Bradyrhizobium liaoningense]
MSDSRRYEGKPLLRLLELYVLRAIDELPQVDQQNLDKMAPKLQAIYGGGGTWHEAVAAAVHMPLDMPSKIRGIWVRNCEIARTNGVTLGAQTFAEMFVDENFAA